MVGVRKIQLLICGKVTCAYALHSGDVWTGEAPDTADPGTRR